jgi:hypothetical protein
VKKLCSLVFLFIYFYNIVGYLVAIRVAQDQIRREVKALLKAGVPEGELITIAIKKDDERLLVWLKPHEFRYRGGMYDVIRSHVSNDTTYYVCINDVQEERLFEHLDEHVRNHMNADARTHKADLAKDLLKAHVVQQMYDPSTPLPVVTVAARPDQFYVSNIVEVPTPPPRHMQTL